MSKVNQIQEALKTLDGGAFQKLADAYLHRRGYDRINSLGSVIGANKTRTGTPDTLIPLPNGKYVFAEHTSQRDGIYGKIQEDLAKCFDETKTGIPVEKIEEVVVCYTSELSPGEMNTLTDECQKRGIKFNPFGISTISFDLYEKYPGLARDFLGVEVDTGQIVSSDEFVATYNKNKLATRLDTSFHFREKEVEQVSQGLAEGNLVIVSGRAGVGKTRFALECSRQFIEQHPEYKDSCIYNRGPDIFVDLKVHFSGPGHYLIIVDDANRISQFSYVIQLLQDQRDDQSIKVIVTVRDYALHKIREAAGPCGGGIDVEVHPLEDNQIKQLLEDECGIRNHDYLDRIAEIAGGNPRLAIMAATVAKRENTLRSIADVSVLYDEYFSSIRQDIDDLDAPNLLKVAGSITFFRAVDRSNKKMMAILQHEFDISGEVFWEAAERLHSLEIVDIYENEVVKVSDQVLATYLFYLAFFKKRALPVSILLDNLFPAFRRQVVDAIWPVWSAFNSEVVSKVMLPCIEQKWDALEKAADEETLLSLINIFWPIKRTETLAYIRDRISAMEFRPVELTTLRFKNSHISIPSHSLLGVLRQFWMIQEGDECQMALSLLLDYLTKQPGELSKVLHILSEDFGIKHTSYRHGYAVQKLVIDALWTRAEEGRNELFARLLLAVAEGYLHTHFVNTEPKGESTVAIIDFQLPPSPELAELRGTIWNRIIYLYQIPALRETVLDFLLNHSSLSPHASEKEIIEQDASTVLPFIKAALVSSNYRHCLVAQTYLDHLERCEVEFGSELRHSFNSPTITLAEVLLDDHTERLTLELDRETYQQLRKEQLRVYFVNYALADYERFFNQCLEIRRELGESREFQFSWRVVEVFWLLAEERPGLYVEVLKYYLDLGDPLRLPVTPVQWLIEVCGVEQSLQTLTQIDYPTKRSWLFGYYQCLSGDAITPEHLAQLYTLYDEASPEELPHDFEFLLNYRSIDVRVVARVVGIILARIEKEPRFAHTLTFLSSPTIDVNVLMEFFSTSDDLHLLKQAYLAATATARYIDHYGVILARILDFDPNFILEYIDLVYEGWDWHHRDKDSHNYSFLWERPDYEDLMRQIVERIYVREQDAVFNTYLDNFFRLREDSVNTRGIRQRQDDLLSNLIRERHNDADFIRYLFVLIAEFPPERRRSCLSLFLVHNKDFEVFAKLPLKSISFNPSVPGYQQRADYIESLLPLFNEVALLQHKRYLEGQLWQMRLDIEDAKKQDFMGN